MGKENGRKREKETGRKSGKERGREKDDKREKGKGKRGQSSTEEQLLLSQNSMSNDCNLDITIYVFSQFSQYMVATSVLITTVIQTIRTDEPECKR